MRFSRRHCMLLFFNKKKKKKLKLILVLNVFIYFHLINRMSTCITGNSYVGVITNDWLALKVHLVVWVEDGSTWLVVIIIISGLENRLVLLMLQIFHTEPLNTRRLEGSCRFAAHSWSRESFQRKDLLPWAIELVNVPPLYIADIDIHILVFPKGFSSLHCHQPPPLRCKLHFLSWALPSVHPALNTYSSERNSMSAKLQLFVHE